MSEVTEYVFQLPTIIVHELCESLDSDQQWEEVARAMPGINSNDIDGCRRCAKPTEALIRIWGSKGYKTLDLYKVFGRVRYVKCMRLLHPYIDEKFHKITSSVIQKKPVLSPRVTNTNDAHSVGRFSEHTQPSTVYSKKATSQAELQFLSEGETSSSSNDIFTGLQNTPMVKYDDIRKATNDFAQEQICGKGGYGVVYRGVWQHTEVAIKRIKTQKDGVNANKERIRQSLQELRHLSKLRHDNILSLYAYSMDGNDPCLIYQFMSNGSLEDRILCRNNTKPLSWELRKSICEGASKGINFLHQIGATPIIHGDIKCANILLDKHMEPKIGDFGLSRDGQVELDAADKSPMIASHIKGTLAYLPPEFTRSKILTPKLDVYSFGVVLLEVATGLRAYSDSRQPHSLVAFVNKITAEIGERPKEVASTLSDKKVELNGKGRPSTITEHFNLENNKHIFSTLLQLGLRCSVERYQSRPK
ncbi:Kinase domain protein [Aphelenchoides besseyi]|nr:Kinase domain protein [Aphelenchoides besseyi]